MADGAGAATAQRATGGSAAPNQRLTQLQAAYGSALFAARGPTAPETTEAFAIVRKSAYGERDAPERLAADYGLWVGSLLPGDLPSMRAHAEVFLSDVEGKPGSPEAGVAHRAAGLTRWFAGEYLEARDHLERALALFEPGRDDDLAFRFGQDAGVSAMAFLAFALWPLGEVDCAISLIDRMQTRMADLAHVSTLALGTVYAAAFAMMRGDRSPARTSVSELTRIAREHDMPLFRAFGPFFEGWATADAGAPADGLESMRRGVELLRAQNVVMHDGLLKIALAEAEARAGDADRAVAILDKALATADHLGYRAFEAELHRVRGQILRRDPVSLAPAEEAFQTAIAVAKRQATRSFELRAELALAKLYQSTTRPTARAPSSHRRLKAFRRRRKCRRSPRRRRCSRSWRPSDALRRKRNRLFERLLRSTQTSASRASALAQQATTRAIWLRATAYATVCASAAPLKDTRKSPKTVRLVAGLRLRGLVAQKAFDRPINAASFEEWVEKCLVPTLSKGEVVVMDNLSSRKEAAGADGYSHGLKSLDGHLDREESDHAAQDSLIVRLRELSSNLVNASATAWLGKS